MNQDNNAKMIFAAGGGKGGVGKSIFSAALGVALAKEGHNTALVDLDLGSANLHTYLGITRKTPTIADFILKKVPSLEEILIDTPCENLMLISGAEYIPGMANPAHWMKLKMMRHIKALPADYVIMDLGAGVHFNTLDFFGMSDRGTVITAPEPAAVMNAYGFIKGALFRKLQTVFRRHPEIGPVIDAESKKPDDEKDLTLDWLKEKVEEIDQDMLTLVSEIEEGFHPDLVLNRLPEGQSPVLIQNLMSLCNEKLGIQLHHAGNIPDVPGIQNYLLDIPGFLFAECGKPYLHTVEKIKNRLVHNSTGTPETSSKANFSDDEVEEIIRFMEGLDETVFNGTNRNTWKLRMYFKPLEVVNFLMSRGVTHEAFYCRDNY